MGPRIREDKGEGGKEDRELPGLGMLAVRSPLRGDWGMVAKRIN